MIHPGQGFQAFVTSEQPDSRPQNVGKLTLDVFDHLGSEGNTVFREQGVEFGGGYDHFRYLGMDNELGRLTMVG